MARIDFFEQDLRLATAGLEPEAIQRELAKFAKSERDKLIASGQASRNYVRYVNGSTSVPEEQVDIPGAIIYQFSLWEPILTFAMNELQRRSPVQTGRFRTSFLVLANQRPITDFDAISPEAEVIITNFQPYVRKAENGLLSTAPRAVFDGTKRALAARFGNDGRNSAAFRFETKWLLVQSGLHPEMPYILKGNGPLTRPVQNKRSSAFRLGKDALTRRKDRQAGQPITYPSIIINMVL